MRIEGASSSWMRIIGPLVAIAALPLLAGCDGVSLGRGPTATPTDQSDTTATPRPTADNRVDRVVTADGELVLPRPPQPLSFTVRGTVLDIAVSEGEEVERDQALAQVDLLPLDMAVVDARAALASALDALEKAEEGASQSELAATRAELSAAESNLARLESGTDLESARLEVERAKNTLWGMQAQRDSICGAAEKGFATQASCDQAQANVQASEQAVQIAQQQQAAVKTTRAQDLSAARARVVSARAALYKLLEGTSDTQLAALRARVEQAAMALEAAEADLEQAILRAPFKGTVTTVHIVEGVSVAPGTPVVTLTQTEPLRFVTTNLSERNVSDVAVGAPATVVLTTYPDEVLEATVQRIASQATEDLGGAVVFAVYLDVEEQRLPLLAGMTGRAEIRVPPES